MQCFERKIITLWVPSFENGHSFKSLNDTTMKFNKNAWNIWIWKVKKYVTKDISDGKLLIIS